MRSLYLRIWLTVVAALALFAAVSGWVVQGHLDAQRQRIEAAAQERLAAWAELLQRSLPPPDAPDEVQRAALADWAQRLRVPLALEGADGRRIAGPSGPWRGEGPRTEGSRSEAPRREGSQAERLPREERTEAALPAEGRAARWLAIPLDDGRTLWVPRPAARRVMLGPPGAGAPSHGHADSRLPGVAPPWLAARFGLPGLPDGVGLAALLLLLFAAVAAGAWPVVRRLTRRLEALKAGVEEFGAGALHRRVSEDGRDEVAALGASFNHAAARIEALLRSHQSLLANASHELRSPLARLKMAVAMIDDAPPPQRAALRKEIGRNIGELDALVEEVLLASRLQAQGGLERREPVALLALARDEAARHGVAVVESLAVSAQATAAAGGEVWVEGEERLLRRALRNLLENARRYGRASDSAEATPEVGERDADGLNVEIGSSGGRALLRVCDRGPGVPEAWRERIFEPFARLPGHAEREGGVGLGLALVRQIAERHGGQVRCLPRPGGGSCFELELPLAPS